MTTEYCKRGLLDIVVNKGQKNTASQHTGDTGHSISELIRSGDPPGAETCVVRLSCVCVGCRDSRESYSFSVWTIFCAIPPYLPLSPRISPYLPVSPRARISPYLERISPYIGMTNRVRPGHDPVLDTSRRGGGAREVPWTRPVSLPPDLSGHQYVTLIRAPILIAPTL